MPKAIHDVLEQAPPAVQRVLKPPILGIISECLQEYWNWKGRVTHETPIPPERREKDALRRCVTDRINLRRGTTISLLEEEVAGVVDVGGLESLILRKMLKQRGGAGE